MLPSVVLTVKATWEMTMKTSLILVTVAAMSVAAGAYAGCRSEGGCRWEENNPNHSQLYLDRRTNRYYYLNERDGCSYWQNGEPRAC